MPTASLQTATLASIYAGQGHFSQAREIYEGLLQQTPGDAALLEKLEALAELERAAVAGRPASVGSGSTDPTCTDVGASSDPDVARRLMVLQILLRSVQSRRR